MCITLQYVGTITRTASIPSRTIISSNSSLSSIATCSKHKFYGGAIYRCSPTTVDDFHAHPRHCGLKYYWISTASQHTLNPAGSRSATSSYPISSTTRSSPRQSIFARRYVFRLRLRSAAFYLSLFFVFFSLSDLLPQFLNFVFSY